MIQIDPAVEGAIKGLAEQWKGVPGASFEGIHDISPEGDGYRVTLRARFAFVTIHPQFHVTKATVDKAIAALKVGVGRPTRGAVEAGKAPPPVAFSDPSPQGCQGCAMALSDADRAVEADTRPHAMWCKLASWRKWASK